MKKRVEDFFHFQKIKYQHRYCGVPLRSFSVYKLSSVSFCVTGWVYLPSGEVTGAEVVLLGKENFIESKRVSLNESEVSHDIQKYLHLDSCNGSLYRLNIGFIYKLSESIVIFLKCNIGGKEYSWRVGSIPNNIHEPNANRVFQYDDCYGCMFSGYSDVIEFDTSLNKNESVDAVDIILPIYNGYEYFDALFPSIEKTSCKYNLIIVDDCSPGEKVRNFLDSYSQRPEVTLLRNDENVGFVKSVNRGLKHSSNDVVLLNSDTELPNGWLERLMMPVWNDERIASVTPFTNSGTICSFPRFCEDNKIATGLDVDDVDSCFRCLSPKGYIVPTGVGFCMAMSRSAIDSVGFLDEENFGKGFGEENDWCQRAISAGFMNIHLNNLFVYHKHGGSFTSEEKSRLVKTNYKKLCKKHPDYDAEVAFYIKADPAFDDRHSALINLVDKFSDQPATVIIGNLYGGGATAFAKTRTKEIAEQGGIVYTIGCMPTAFNYQVGGNNNVNMNSSSANKFIYTVKTNFKNYEFDSFYPSLSDALDSIKNVGAILINGLQGFPNWQELHNEISKFHKDTGSKLIYFLHDFYCTCPWYSLVGMHDTYCTLPNIDECSSCFDHHPDLWMLEIDSMKEYRDTSKILLDDADKIVAFCNDSKHIINSVFPDLKNIVVKPHKDSYVNFNFAKSKSEIFTIGILGAINENKGLDIIKSLGSYIDRYDIDAKIVLLGYTSSDIPAKCVKITGKYDGDRLSELLDENPIDVFLFPSVWPETFSFVTTEIMSMDAPLVCFDLGAQAERISKYEKGKVIPLNSSSVEIYRALKEQAEKFSK